MGEKNKTRVASISVFLLTSVVAVVAGLALTLQTEREQNERLDRLLRQSEGLRLIAHSSLEKPRNPGLAVALATAGARLHPGPEANNALLEAVDANHEHRVLRGHKSPVGAARYSPDGNRIVTTASRHWYTFGPEPAAIWDAESGERLAQLSEEWTITSAAFSPQGRRILTAASPTTWHNFTDDQLADRPPAVWDAQRAVKVGQLTDAFLFEALPTAFRTVGKKTEIVAPAKGNTARIYNASGDEERSLEGHQRRVTYAGFSPDGSRIVTISDDNTVRIWNADSCELMRKLDLWKQQRPAQKYALVETAAFSPDGRSLLTAASGLGVHLWDLETGEPTNLGSGEFAVFSPDGEMIAIFHYDTARVVDVHAHAVVSRLDHLRQIRHLEFSADSRLLVTATQEENRFAAFEAATGKLAAEFRGHSLNVQFVSFNPDGHRLVSASEDRTARVWNLASGAQQSRFPVKIDPRRPQLSFRPDGEQLVVVTEPEWRTTVWGEDNTSRPQPIYSVGGKHRLPGVAEQRFVTTSEDQVVVRELSSGAEVASLTTHGTEVREARISAAGERVLILCKDGTMCLWTLEGNQKVQLAGPINAVNAGEFHPVDRRAATGSKDGFVRIWNTVTGQEVTKLPHHVPIQGVKYSSDGTMLLAVTGRNKIHLWDTERHKPLHILEAESRRFDRAEFSIDGKYVIAHREFGGNAVVCWKVASGEQVNTLADVTGQVHVQISPSDPIAAVASDQSGLILWNFVSGETRKLSEKPCAYAVFTAGGQRILSATAQPTTRYHLSRQADAGFSDPRLQLWNAEGTLLRETPTRHGFVRWLREVAQSGLVIVGGMSHAARIFDTRTHNQVATLHGHAAPICFARFTPDGQQIVTCSWDQTAVVWDPTTQRPLHVLAGHNSPIKAAAMSSDGKLMATGDAKGTVIVWDLEEGMLVRRLEGLSNAVAHCSFSAFAARLLAYTTEGRLQIWKTSTGRTVDTQQHETDDIVWAEYATQGSALLIVSRTAGRRKKVKVLPAEGQAAVELPHDERISHVRLAPRGRRVLTILRDTSGTSTRDVVSIWNADSGQRLISIQEPGRPIHHADFNSAGTLLMTHHGKTIAVWDLENGNRILNLSGGFDFNVAPAAESFSPDGNLLVAFSPPKQVRAVALDQLGRANGDVSRLLSENERARFLVKKLD